MISYTWMNYIKLKIPKIMITLFAKFHNYFLYLKRKKRRKIFHLHYTCNKDFRFGYLFYVRKKIRQWKTRNFSINLTLKTYNRISYKKQRKALNTFVVGLQTFECSKLTFIQCIWSKKRFFLCISYSSFHQHHRIFLNFSFFIFSLSQKAYNSIVSFMWYI